MYKLQIAAGIPWCGEGEGEGRVLAWTGRQVDMQVCCSITAASLKMNVWQDLEPAEPLGPTDAANKPAPAKPAAPQKPAEPEPESDEQRERRAKMQHKEEALKAKELGNAAYKAKNFDEAISHYDKAYELFDEDISFLTNRCVPVDFATPVCRLRVSEAQGFVLVS